MIEIRLLGQFSVQRDSEPIMIASRPAQSLFAYLVLHPHIAHRREKLSGTFWPEATESNARSNLRHALWRIRKALGNGEEKADGLLAADSFTISLTPNTDVWIDVSVLEQRLPADPTPEQIEACVTVYNGELLPGFYDDWAVLHRERLRAIFDEKMQLFLNGLLVKGLWREVIKQSEDWIALGQVPEPAYRALMIAQFALGDRASVAATYHRCRETLRQELDVDPSEQTEATYRQLEDGIMPIITPATADEEVMVPGSITVARSLLRQHRQAEHKMLEPAGLGTIFTNLDQLELNQDDAIYLFRSVLSQEVELQPWVEAVDNPELVTVALGALYKEHPQPPVRWRIVESLSILESAEADDLLLEILSADDSPVVKTEAALVASDHGQLDPIMQALTTAINTNEDQAALSAFTAVADVHGLPENLHYPKSVVYLSLARRRWAVKRRAILKQTWRAGAAGALALIPLGAISPFYSAWVSPEEYAVTVQGLPVPAWSLIGVVGHMVIGGPQGLATGFAAGLSDVLSFGTKWLRSRLLFGLAAGLMHVTYLIVAASARLLEPEASPVIYNLSSFVYGLLLGMLLSLVIPPLGRRVTLRRHIGRTLLVALSLSLVTVPYVYLTYPGIELRILPHRVALVWLLSFGLSLAFIARSNDDQS